MRTRKTIFVFAAMNQEEQYWIPYTVQKKIMTGQQARAGSWAELLIRYRLYQAARIPSLPSTMNMPAPPTPIETDCPPLIQACMSCFSSPSRISLTEILLLARQYKTAFPGLFLPEILHSLEKDISLFPYIIPLFQEEQRAWSNYFELTIPFRTYEQKEDWLSLPKSALSISWFLAFLTDRCSHYQDWWSQLPAQHRLHLLQSSLSFPFPSARWIKMNSKDRSKKVKAVLNALLLAHRDPERYSEAQRFIAIHLRYQNDKFVWTNENAPFESVSLPAINAEAVPFWPGLAWIHPEDWFRHLSLDGKQISIAIARSDHAEELSYALLHAALKHKASDWISYGIHLLQDLQAIRMFDHASWPTLASQIPSKPLFDTLQKKFRQAKTALDKLDLIQYWLAPSGKFIPKEMSESISHLIWPLLPAIRHGDIELLNNQSFLSYLALHIHPSVRKQLPRSERADRNEPFRSIIDYRWTVYKKMQEWANQHNSDTHRK